MAGSPRPHGQQQSGANGALLAPVLALVLVLAGCAGRQSAAPTGLAFGAGDPRAVVLVGISAGQRDGTVTFTRLQEGSNRLASTSAYERTVEFSVSNEDAATAFVVLPGRYLVSQASIVTHRGREYRSGFYGSPGLHFGHHGFHHGWHHGFHHDWAPRQITVTEGERFQVQDGPRGIENQSWIITVWPGQVTSLGHFAFEWDKANNVLNVAQTPFNERAKTLALAPYTGVTAPVVDAEWSLYGPDLPPPPMMHWSNAY